MLSNYLPNRHGLYDPQFEHDACGVGFVVQMKGLASHSIVRQGLVILANLGHCGAIVKKAIIINGPVYCSLLEKELQRNNERYTFSENISTAILIHQPEFIWGLALRLFVMSKASVSLFSRGNLSRHCEQPYWTRDALKTSLI